jgi:hypothetical protein
LSTSVQECFFFYKCWWRTVEPFDEKSVVVVNLNPNTTIITNLKIIDDPITQS